MLILLSASVCAELCAQTIPLTGYGEKGSTGKSAVGSSRGEILKSGGKMDVRILPVEKGMNYNDGRLQEMEKAMQEREWGSEDTAWERARTIDTKESYERYCAMYPYGAHVSAANDRLVEIQIDEMMSGSHSRLPQMRHIEVDEDSPTSTIMVTNFTDYPLTVLYSGEETRSVVISPGLTHAVTLKNGAYRIAASVPPSRIRPYAGQETLTGGRYEVGYYVVSQ